ncbi:hypothetical protein C8R44DRAFT_955621 [Mycena epipterygia]|nr:hypothetical protein C8R44DRAFT_955621 [Mycena epipterygia]
MKSNTLPASRAVRKFAPYSPLPSRPSAATARYGAHLRAAALAPYEALNTWLAANITDGSTVVPERTLHAHEALCILTMFILKDKDVGSIFQGPDVYTLVLEIQLHGKSKSPLMRLGRFLGSSDDGDAPLWTRLFKPRESYHILETSTFAATLACGMTNIAVQSVSTETISARMRAWACNVSLGTCVDAAVVRHCIRLAFQEPPIINPEVGTEVVSTRRLKPGLRQKNTAAVPSLKARPLIKRAMKQNYYKPSSRFDQFWARRQPVLATGGQILTVDISPHQHCRFSPTPTVFTCPAQILKEICLLPTSFPVTALSAKENLSPCLNANGTRPETEEL